MLDLLTREPWLIPVAICFLIPIAGIALGFVKSVQKARQVELEVSLKLEMLQRGMSADEIVRVLQARSGHDDLPGRCATSGQEVPCGIEKR
jgi:hypothetical protein